MRTAAAYIRVSTDSQTEYSPDSQIRLIRDYAKRNGISVLDEFIFEDEGISGRKADKRPSFQKMLYEAKQKKFDVVLIYHTSRFARNHEESIIYRSMLKRQGVEVISITQPNIDEKTDLLMNALYAVMDERYSLDLSENVRRGMIEKAMRGECVSSVPYGYKMVAGNKIPQLVEEKAEVARLIFDKFIYGGETIWAITRFLNASGIPSPKNKKWQRDRLEDMLANPFYCGCIRWNLKDSSKREKPEDERIIRDGRHEPLITKEEHEIVIEKLSKIRKRAGGGAKHISHWLTGLIRCSSCGSGLNIINTASTGGEKHFRCRGYVMGKCVTTQYTRADLIEYCFFTSLEEVLRSPAGVCFEIPAQNQNTVSEKTAIDKAIEREKKKLARAKEAYENGVYQLSEYKESKSKIEAEIQRYDAQLKDIISKNFGATDVSAKKKTITSVQEVIEFLKSPDNTAESKRAVANSVVSHIVYDKKTRIFKVFYYIP